MNKNVKSPKKRNAFISVLLICALLITSIFAFLTATDNKTNRFTVGKIDITLQEYDENGNKWWVEDENGYPTDDLTPEVDANDNDIMDELENILPGKVVGKEPRATNVGKNAEWTFISIGIPTADKSDILQGEDSNGVVNIEGAEETIEVKAYGVQTEVTDEDTETAEGVWAKYNGAENIEAIDYTALFGEEATDGLSTRIQLFKSIFDDEAGYNEDDWTLIDSYKSSDGNNYYIYAYNTLLAVNAETSGIVDGFKLIEAIGETEPVTLNYYAEINTTNEDTGVAAAEIDLSVLAPVFEGYELVKSETFTPGESIGDLYYDTNLMKEGYNFDWVDAETNKVAYSNMTITKTTNLRASYEDMELINVIPKEYLVYESIGGIMKPLGVHASYWEDHPDVTECSLVFPNTITIDASEQTTVELAYFDKFNTTNANKNKEYRKTSNGYIVTASSNGLSRLSGTYDVGPYANGNLRISLNPIDTFENMITGYGTENMPSWGERSVVYFKTNDTIKTVVINKNFTTPVTFNNYNCQEIKENKISGPVVARPLPFENIIVEHGVKDITLFKSENLKTVTLPKSLIHISASTSPLPIGTNLPDSLQNYDINLLNCGVTNFIVPVSSQGIWVRLAEGSTITLQNKFKGIININNENSSVATEYTIIYPGTFDEFSDNVRLQCSNGSTNFLRNTTINCSDGIATWDRCIKTPIPETTAYEYIPVFSIK